VTVADDQIYERYQAKAIDEVNALGHDIAEWLTESHPGAAPVLGTGHPLADIMLVKHRPMPAEVQEGVAFFGRAGQAVLKSLQRKVDRVPATELATPHAGGVDDILGLDLTLFGPHPAHDAVADDDLHDRRLLKEDRARRPGRVVCRAART